MHLLTTDRLICPRCGPEFGLILFSDRLEDRRVHEGFFGCANCREEYPVRGGFGDLRPSPRGEEGGETVPPPKDSEGAIRLAALLGVQEGPGFLLLSGSSVAYAEPLAALIEGIEVIALHPRMRNVGEVPGVSRITAASTLPFRSGSLRGVVLEGEVGISRLIEGARTLGGRGRLVFLNPLVGTAGRMIEQGFDLLIEENSVLVGELRRG